MIVLGIESSCDETAAAVVENGEKVLSSIVSSQTDIHHRYGGVVPELASRKHIESIVPVVNEAIQASGRILSEIDGVAVTQGPGLIGCLLVGFSFAKAWAWARDIPVVGVDHLEGHINSVFICDNPPQFPFVALLVSGGHTSIYHVTSHTQARVMGRTRDDAAGEAFDKVAKMLNLGYPGGSIIDELAARGDPKKIKFPRSYLDKNGFDFSFSGMKTAVNRYIQNHQDEYQEQAADIAAGFQDAVTDVLCFKLMKAAQEAGCNHIAIVGGVAANKGLREKIRSQAVDQNLTLHIPPIDLCGDNAAMIAASGFHYLKAGHQLPLDADVYSRIQK
ncbi:MAG: tRNA (adenosine(37)-N6)-threonylcarbamoyltransferase complex transferase subunit TsaD [Desulfobacterium sp.]|nr:tRNA (adenosine(37)-N6)-threonylcarbamoyltransferase complex transferase subunit TsaD [Desulfobacterium sp.]